MQTGSKELYPAKDCRAQYQVTCRAPRACCRPPAARPRAAAARDHILPTAPGTCARPTPPARPPPWRAPGATMAHSALFRFRACMHAIFSQLMNLPLAGPGAQQAACHGSRREERWCPPTMLQRSGNHLHEVVIREVKAASSGHKRAHLGVLVRGVGQQALQQRRRVHALGRRAQRGRHLAAANEGFYLWNCCFVARVTVSRPALTYGMSSAPADPCASIIKRTGQCSDTFSKTFWGLRLFRSHGMPWLSQKVTSWHSTKMVARPPPR